MLMTGAKILMECLLEQGVDTVFGFPGGTILNVYDELMNYPGIRHILTAHEQGACHAADGYARSTGRVGVCFATSGPGATNLVTGIATAYMDSSPVVCITCNVELPLLGKDSFQEVDITGVTMPITKCNYLVREVDQLADTVREAFAIARSGRPGPVLIDIPHNVTLEMTNHEPLARGEHGMSGRLGQLMKRSSQNFRAPEPNYRDIDVLADMIRASQRPFVICGGGVVRSRANAEFEAFANRIDAPVGLTVMGAGGFRGLNPLATGLVGMHGSQASNMAVDACDLLIAVGCRFSDRVALKPDSFARNARVVQIDIDRSEINKNVETAHHIVGDARRVLQLLNERLEQLDHADWRDYVFSFKTQTEYDEVGDHMTPSQVLDAIARIVPRDAIFATDVGQHQMWAIQHLHFEYSGQLVTSGGFGTMGFGLGAAIGAKAGNPDKPVVLITGDGSFRMNMNELSTSRYHGLPVIVVLFDNGALGMVRQWQTLTCSGRHSQTTLDRGPDFVKLAGAYGLEGCRVTRVDQLEEALQKALSSGETTVIDCAIDIDEMVRPMVPGGRNITDFMVD